MQIWIRITTQALVLPLISSLRSDPHANGGLAASVITQVCRSSLFARHLLVFLPHLFFPPSDIEVLTWLFQQFSSSLSHTHTHFVKTVFKKKKEKKILVLIEASLMWQRRRCHHGPVFSRPTWVITSEYGNVEIDLNDGFNSTLKEGQRKTAVGLLVAVFALYSLFYTDCSRSWNQTG